MPHAMQIVHRTGVLLAPLVFGLSSAVLHADEVTDWTQIMLQAAHTANVTSTIVQSRSAAIVTASMYDAVNGIHGRYRPIYVSPGAPAGASARAAGIQAAYVNLLKLYPAQAGTLDAARAGSLSGLVCSAKHERREERCEKSISDGIAWGQTVADAIWTWRSSDGFTPPPPPFLGGDDVGEWRPTPPAFASGAAPQFATMTPWALVTPSQFRPGGPPPLSSQLYANVLNETRVMGSLSSTLRTTDQTAYAQFWATSTPVYNWNSVALTLCGQRHLSLLQHARVVAALNLAMADAGIALWDAKYHYVSWRPITAIALADTDGNRYTTADPSWLPLITTPAHPEYPSAHSGFSAAGTTVLAELFGEHSSFVVTSDALPGVVRSFSSFRGALAEIANARVFGGIHFRSSCEDGQVLGARVAGYILRNNFQHSRENDHDNDGGDR